MHLLAALLLVLAAQEKEKITLKWNPKQGDVLTATEKTAIEAKGSAQGQELEFTNKSTKKTVTTYTTVKEGKVTKKTIEFKESTEEGRQPGQDDEQKKELDLHGKTVTLMEKDGKLVMEGADDVDEKETKKLKLDDGWAHFLPAKEIAVGDSWEITGDALKKAMEDEEFDGGKVTFKLKEVKEIDKVKCAVLQATFDVQGTAQEGQIKLKLKLEGEVVVRIDRGYAMSMKAKGTIVITSADSDEDPMFKAEGPMTLETSQTLKE
jgi:hypothetical protein